MKDDLTIPKFLRVTKKDAAKRAAAWEAAPPVPAPAQPISVKRGEYPEHWLQDPGTKALIAQMAADRESRALARAAAKAAERAARPPRRSALEGLTPLSAVLDGMGAAAPSRRAAMRAVERACTVHVRWHFRPDQLAGLERTLAKAAEAAPRKGTPRQDHDPAATIAVAKGAKNPKKPGSAAHQRWDVLFKHDGKTVAAFIKSGGNPVTLSNAVSASVVSLKKGDSLR